MPHLPDDSEITAFFENITPDDVLNEPDQTHIRTQHSPANVSDPHSFESFWLGRLGEFTALERPFAALHDGKTIYFYAHRPGEPDWDYLQRIRRDAETLNAKWAFVCHPGRAARGGESGKADASAKDAKELISKSAHDCYLWYAASIEHDEVFGIVTEDGEMVRSSNKNGASPHLREVYKGMKGA